MIRLQIILLLLTVVAGSFGFWVSVRHGLGSVYGIWAYGSEKNPSLDFALFDSTLLKFAETDASEDQLKEEIKLSLEGNVRNSSSKEFKSALSDWFRKKMFEPDIMEELLDQVKVPIDVHNSGMMGSKRKYSSCAVVGNSGILLNKEYGELIDGHEAVIRLKNARIKSFHKNVGSKTTISFISSIVLHHCAVKVDCFCHPYGTAVSIVLYITRPAHFLDYVMCNSSHKSPLIVTDPRLDTLCYRIVKYYSLKRFADGGGLNKTFEQWYSAHNGSMFIYSSGMEAVTLALGICDRVSLFGFGKSTDAKHHYHTNQKQELSIHDYQAEYNFYHDLVKKPHAIPFFSDSFKFPPVLSKHGDQFLRSPIISSPMKRKVRPQIVLLQLIVVAATIGFWVVFRAGFGSVYPDGDTATRNPSLDFRLCNSTLLKLAEVDDGEAQMRSEIEQTLAGSLSNPTRFRTFVTWLRLAYVSDIRGRISKEFKSALSDWFRKKRFQPDIMFELIDQVKVPIDVHNSYLMGSKRKYSSCAVVGNSGILLNTEYGELIDGHEAVIRLKNARVKSFEKNVGSKTSMSFMNSNTLHKCASKADCFCHPYGSNVPIVVYMTRPDHFLDYVVCNSSHKSPLIVIDPRLDTLCSRVVKYYSLKRFADGGPNKTLREWNAAYCGSLFHFSSGMEAVTLALGICDRVSLFGFGKSNATKHHYHTNQKQELGLHDYQAEYDFYHDLAENPRAIPFFSERFQFPPVVIHR